MLAVAARAARAAPGSGLSRPVPDQQLITVTAASYQVTTATLTGYRRRGTRCAIFLHVGTGSATAGCVSLPVRELLRVLRWLDLRHSPQITIGAR